MQVHLGWRLRECYPQILYLGADSRLGRVLDRLPAALDAADVGRHVPAAFKDDLIALMPRLRRYAQRLALDATEADEPRPVHAAQGLGNRQQFRPGTSLVAWLFNILRKSFINGRRKYRRRVADSNGFHAAALVDLADQEHKLGLRELESAIGRLTPEHREALLRVAVDGLTYEAAAAVIGCPPGTVESRVNRTRDRLARELGGA